MWHPQNDVSVELWKEGVFKIAFRETISKYLLFEQPYIKSVRPNNDFTETV